MFTYKQHAPQRLSSPLPRVRAAHLAMHFRARTKNRAAPPQSMTPSSVNARRMRAAFALVAQCLMVYSPLLASTCGQALRA